MINKLKSLANQAIGDSGIMIAVGWLITEMIGISNAVFAVIAVIYAFAAATKSDKIALGVAFCVVIVAAGWISKSGLLT
ncbi:hypothetical protein ANOBCDAF_00418 [Pleomorphomonas sp. T1.2MG-36]|uniref:hypothetical protein n=1 Tax=Pleomorphomonas sp. T1.2MG-36 TaxID=3041167 RepID=UPI0024774259|nr:hypothetical protein [Pleomorphomonas sp. T1.2MG-36]CAI9400117.1 hypothetical protein ANOBCDAF_00418 [Pleomorphomonas sp. T1.2MG-36]